ncbi:putative bifunctional diguanylate cyclase/phosphodiesterase [Asticcacaulis solisilvae]|uniref:putative bifunctional diguanylate cyclase/phosphodiesterase n=1 Tax=Asticcacaulis solisilvae TaxID=1217274 RepID=UPI003FD74E4F
MFPSIHVGLKAIRAALDRVVERRKALASMDECGIHLRAETAESLRPVVQGYLVIVAAYFAVQTVFYRVPGDPGWLPLSAFLTVAICGWMLYLIRGTRRIRRLDLAGHSVNLMLVIDTLLDIHLQYNSIKLIYFALLLPVFAASGARARVAVPGSLVSMVLFTVFAWRWEAAHVADYAWVAATALVSGLSISGILRSALLRVVRAQVTTECHRQQAQTLADCDALTGLANRRSFFRHAETVLAGDAPFALALIDLDGFKPVNDTYGHGTGDDLLVTVADRLRGVCGADGFPARMGGDEFAIVLTGDCHDDALQVFGARLCDALRETYVLGPVATTISASVGFVRGEAAFTVSQLLERADYALYFAKQNLRGAPVIFNARHEAEMRDFSQVDHALRTADLDQELSIVFQPQVDVVENRTVAFEALARWHSATLGPVAPDIFIRAAERSGLITDITLKLLRKTLRHMAVWPETVRVSFNLSARDLRSAISIGNICAAIRDSGVDPRRIELEITETAMLTDFDQACQALTVLKALGCRIAVDDFGEGYSSFGYIHRLPVDKIKIDRTFVTQLVRHRSAIKIVKTIIDLCRNLELDCVIEGVETQAELTKLIQVRARYIQGYLFARPMPAEAVLAHLDTEALDAPRIQAAE